MALRILSSAFSIIRTGLVTNSARIATSLFAVAAKCKYETSMKTRQLKEIQWRQSSTSIWSSRLGSWPRLHTWLIRRCFSAGLVNKGLHKINSPQEMCYDMSIYGEHFHSKVIGTLVVFLGYKIPILVFF